MRRLLEIEKLVQYGLVLPVMYVVLLIVKSIFAIGRKGPTGIAIKGLGISFIIKSGCVHFDPASPDGCDLGLIVRMAPLETPDTTTEKGELNT
jgi:hypothetical protein